MANTKNAFAALKKGATWNDAAKKAKVSIEDKEGTAILAKALIDETKDPTKHRAVESAYNEILNDIKSTLKLGKEPKREDFINAARKANDILTVLNDALNQDSVILHPKLIRMLQEKVQIALAALNANKPGMVSAAGKSVGSKMKSTAAGIIGGMASQLTEGIPFAPEMLAFAGAKIKGIGGGASSVQTDMAATLQDDSGGGSDAEGAEETGGITSPVEKAKEEIMGGESAGGSGGGSGGGLDFTNELLINIDDNLQFIRDNSETEESRRERLRNKGAEGAGGLLGKGKGKGKGAGVGAGGGATGFLADLGGNALGSFLGVKGLPKSFLTRVAMLRVLGALGPLLLNPVVLAAIAVGGLAWWLMGDEETPQSKAERKRLEDAKAKSKQMIDEGRNGVKGGNVAEAIKLAGGNKVALAQHEKRKKEFEAMPGAAESNVEMPSKDADLTILDAKIALINSLYEQKELLKKTSTAEEQKKLNSDIDVLDGQLAQLEEQKKKLKGAEETGGKKEKYKFKLGGIVPGKKGEPVPALVHGEEIVFDNEASEKMHASVSLLKGTDFSTLEEFNAAGKDSVGYTALMERFSEGMLNSKVGGQLKNMSMLFGLAGHGQLGKTDMFGSQVDKYSMSGETVEKLLEKLNYFKERGDHVSGLVERGGRGGEKRVRNMSELNAVRAIQEISKSMALIDTPEEIAALQPDNMRLSPKEAERIGQSFMKDQRFDNFLQGETDRNKQIFTSSQKIGMNLNTAQAEKDGMASVAGSSPTVVSADTNIVNNNSSTFIPPIDPGGGMGRGLTTARS